MAANAISLAGVCKSFRVPLDRSTSLKYRVAHMRSASRYRELRALHDITFDVPQGQFLGITGPNGCGKSTLLKIMSKIYRPDSGTMTIAGPVSPFLELGVGFNPELTARENIFLGGAVIGIRRSELKGRVDDILDFADLTHFADQRLKNFSSGMQVRLAFSVAIQADAGILLMDEVLAVGDARFQEKCFDVFARYKREGRTVVLVTHDLGALTNYCDRALLIDEGAVVADGPASDVVSEYRQRVGEASEADDKKAATKTGGKDIGARWGTREVEITSVRMRSGEGVTHSTFSTGEPLTVEIDYAVHEQVDEIVCGLAFKRNDGLNLAGPNTKADGMVLRCPAAGSTGTIAYRVATTRLLAGSYLLTAAIYDGPAAHAYDHRDDVAHFRIVDNKGRYGIVDLSGTWDLPPDVATVPAAKNTGTTR